MNYVTGPGGCRGMISQEAELLDFETISNKIAFECLYRFYGDYVKVQKGGGLPFVPFPHLSQYDFKVST